MTEIEERYLTLAREFVDSFKQALIIREAIKEQKRKGTRKKVDKESLKALKGMLRNVYAWQDQQYEEALIVREVMDD